MGTSHDILEWRIADLEREKADLKYYLKDDIEKSHKLAHKYSGKKDVIMHFYEARIIDNERILRKIAEFEKETKNNEE